MSWKAKDQQGEADRYQKAFRFRGMRELKQDEQDVIPTSNKKELSPNRRQLLYTKMCFGFRAYLPCSFFLFSW